MPKAESLALAFFCLCPFRPLAGQEETLLAARDQTLVQALLPGLGLSQENSVRVTRIVPDPLMQGHDARIAQYYRGVPVLGGEGILHQSGPRTRSVTDAFLRGLNLDPDPLVPPGEALAVAMRDLAPAAPLDRPPSIRLMAARLGSRDALVHRIHLESGAGAQTAQWDYLVDAQTGAILRKWPSLRTGRAALGEGYSQYSGTVTLNTTSLGKAKGYELRDWTRGDTGNVILDYNNQVAGDGAVFLSSTNSWGDGKNYVPATPSDSANGQTAAVDAAYGLQATWDYYGKVHGRNGIDGTGRAVTMRVHFDNNFDNAFWDDACFCVSAGDGQMFKSLTSLDVIGHELSHGVCAATANLEYVGESGSLNEANSDINGVMVKYYARGGRGATIGNWGGTWTIGEELETPAFPKPLRYLYRPSLDGQSPDSWTRKLADMDVHYGSGPMNRCFYFLCQGASPQPDSDFHSEFLAAGMTGLGQDRAARIWYRALTHYLTSTSGYREARNAAISAATDLYGSGSPELQAVWNAFHAINVGDAWSE